MNIHIEIALEKSIIFWSKDLVFAFYSNVQFIFSKQTGEISFEIEKAAFKTGKRNHLKLNSLDTVLSHGPAATRFHLDQYLTS